MIAVGGDYDFHELVREVQTYDPPTDLGCFLDIITEGYYEGEYRYGELPDTDPYGQPYRMVKAGDLADLKVDMESVRAQAALAYVAFLPPETWVVLHWS
jgi:hypothetical protein